MTVEYPHLLGSIIHDVKSLVRKGLSNAQLLQRHLQQNGGDDEALAKIGAIVSAQQDLDLLMVRLSALRDATTLSGDVLLKDRSELDTVLLEIKVAHRPEVATLNGEIHVGSVPACLVPKKLRNVLTELITNAVRYREADRPLKISIEASLERDQLELRVTDNGTGWSPQYQHKLFQPFQRLTAKSGFGLGLTICRAITETAGGTIVAAPLDPGAVFTIKIPATSV